jgi:hypothetical protein
MKVPSFHTPRFWCRVLSVVLFRIAFTALVAISTTGLYAKQPVPGGNAPDANILKACKSLSFIENKGQITDQFQHPRHDIQFSVAAANGLNIFIGDGAIHYQFCKIIRDSNATGAIETQDFGNYIQLYTKFLMH